MNKQLLSPFFLMLIACLSLYFFNFGCAKQPADETLKVKNNHQQLTDLKPIKQSNNKTSSPSVVIRESRNKLKLFGDQGNWIATFPITETTRMSPKYSYPHLEVNFSSEIPKPIIPTISQKSIVKKINLQKGSKPMRIKAIEFVLKQEIQFLISRPRSSFAKILLVPKQESALNKQHSRSEISSDHRPYDLTDLNFRQKDSGKLVIILKADNHISYHMQQSPKDTLAIFFPMMHAPPLYTKLYRVNKFKTPVRSVLIQNKDQGCLFTLAMDQTMKRQPITISREQHSLSLEIKPAETEIASTSTNHYQQTKQTIPKKRSLSSVADQENLQTETDQNNTQQSSLYPDMGEDYSGAKVSLDFQDADIEHVLRLIANVANLNLILDDKVQGKVSLKLNNVPWDQALDLILQQKDLDKIKKGNILRITTQKQLREEKKNAIEAQQMDKKVKKMNKELAPLNTEYIQINYAKAGTLKPQIETFLSERGQISSNQRTNQLIVSDTRETIQKIRRVIHKLDRSERQVLIEARIVYATDQFQRNIGIKWGGNLDYRSVYHGDQFVQGLYGTLGDSSSNSSGMAVNLPIAEGTKTFGIGGFISKLTGSDTYTLDAQLELGESKGQVKTISSPRIVTLNNQQAIVEQGTMIANLIKDEETGQTTTEYTEATLKLSVTPQITPDNKLILDLIIQDDSPVVGSEDIETKSAQTKLFVDNKQTIVLGGVQMLRQTQSNDRVPGVSKIPFLGWLFKNKAKSNQKRELLIFIKPKIL
ncbi:MAG TPA: type IV pilus secretin PilQ [Desulfohalobiaceae bacterium]|nr:type IV pilus secretin PilQ [Desulfohalobiaceae bacterium]